MNQQLELHIEELSLRGFSRRDAHAIGEAIQVELYRLFREQGIPKNWSTEIRLNRLNLGTIHLQPNTKPQIVGTQIATNLYAGFSSKPDTSNFQQKSAKGQQISSALDRPQK